MGANALLFGWTLCCTFAATVDGLDRHYGEILKRPTGSDFLKRDIIGNYDAKDVQNCPKKGGRICNDQGVCNAAKEGQAAYCLCFDGYFGAACESKHCPGYRWKDQTGTNQPLKGPAVDHLTQFIECNNQGKCHHDDSSIGAQDAGRCECTSPFYGDACASRTCPSYEGRICNDQGSCDTSAKAVTRCNCRYPFFGDVCEKAHCRSARLDRVTSTTGAVLDTPEEHMNNYFECSGHGTCHYETGAAAITKLASMPQMSHRTGSWGFCQCTTGWTGVECSVKDCPATNSGVCSGKGSCDSSMGECTCIWPFHGKTCELKYCPGTRMELTTTLNTKLQSTTVVNACNGHGTCHTSKSSTHEAGTCECKHPYTTDDCTFIPPPSASGKLCSGQGVVSGSECRCTWPYFHGAKMACENKMCPGSRYTKSTHVATNTAFDPNEYTQCNGHGTCDISNADRSKLGTCMCEEGWLGPDCSVTDCPNAFGKRCNGQGTCESNPVSGRGLCVCNDGHFGASCEFKHCDGFEIKHTQQMLTRAMLPSDFYECHANTKAPRGTCNHDTGLCTCFPQFTGTVCQNIQCPYHNGKRCNGQGRCDTTDIQRNSVTESTQSERSLNGRCKCNPTHEGSACHLKMCPIGSTGGICSGKGTCDQTAGECVCQENYFGNDCSHGDGTPIVDL